MIYIITLTQQIEAVRLGGDAIEGRRGFSRREREYLAPHIEAAGRSLERHREAVELLRRLVKCAAGGVAKDEAIAFLSKFDAECAP